GVAGPARCLAGDAQDPAAHEARAGLARHLGQDGRATVVPSVTSRPPRSRRWRRTPPAGGAPGCGRASAPGALEAVTTLPRPVAVEPVPGARPPSVVVGAPAQGLERRPAAESLAVKEPRPSEPAREELLPPAQACSEPAFAWPPPAPPVVRAWRGGAR